MTLIRRIEHYHTPDLGEQWQSNVFTTRAALIVEFVTLLTLKILIIVNHYHHSHKRTFFYGEEFTFVLSIDASMHQCVICICMVCSNVETME